MSNSKKIGESKGWEGYSLDTYAGKLITIGKGGYYIIDPNDGSHKNVSNADWSGYFLTGTNSQIMAFSSSTDKGGVYKIDFETGKSTKLSDAKWAGYVMDGLYDCIIALGSGGIYKIFEDGTHEHLSKSDWSGYSICNVNRQHIYSIGPGGYYKINTSDGSSKKLSGDKWEHFKLVSNDNDKVLAIKYNGEGGVYHVNHEDGSYKKLSTANWKGYSNRCCNGEIFGIGVGGLFIQFRSYKCPKSRTIQFLQIHIIVDKNCRICL